MVEDETFEFNNALVDALRQKTKELIQRLEKEGREKVAQEALIDVALRFNGEDTLTSIRNMASSPEKFLDADFRELSPVGEAELDKINNSAMQFFMKTNDELMGYIEQRCGNDAQAWLETYGGIESYEQLEKEFNFR